MRRRDIEQARGTPPGCEEVVLVDDQDRPTGVAEKLHVHRTGQLHRAVSVFLFDARGRMWLQRRALSKYHSPGLWTNACCTHPRPGEEVGEAARRRVREELGCESPELEPAFGLVYYAELEDGLIEHEYDHVFVGELRRRPIPDPSEVDEVRCVSTVALRREIEAHPERFTPWFRVAFEPALVSSGRHPHASVPRTWPGSSPTLAARLVPPEHGRAQRSP